MSELQVPRRVVDSSSPTAGAQYPKDLSLGRTRQQLQHQAQGTLHHRALLSGPPYNGRSNSQAMPGQTLGQAFLDIVGFGGAPLWRGLVVPILFAFLVAANLATVLCFRYLNGSSLCAALTTSAQASWPCLQPPPHPPCSIAITGMHTSCAPIFLITT